MTCTSDDCIGEESEIQVKKTLNDKYYKMKEQNTNKINKDQRLYANKQFGSVCNSDFKYLNILHCK